MKKLVVVLFYLLFVQTIIFAQDINQYKYVIVPSRFEGFKTENQYRTSTLIKYLFSNEGFSVVYDNKMPEELLQNRCLGLKVQLLDNPKLFTTNTVLSLLDCNGIAIMTSNEGSSKTKELEQAYREAISEAFGSFRGLNYSYEPIEEAKTAEPITISYKNDIKSVDYTDKTKEVQMQNTTAGLLDKLELPATTEENVSKDILYAQPIEGGYQLVDTTPKIVYKLKSTSVPDVFLVNENGKSGVVFKNEGKWFIEFDQKGGKPKELHIRF